MTMCYASVFHHCHLEMHHHLHHYYYHHHYQYHYHQHHHNFEKKSIQKLSIVAEIVTSL